MNTNNNMIALVNEKDEITGYEDKLVVHQKGLLHRAFSIFIVNSSNEILLQQRAVEKYHSGGLWTNTCCSHAIPDELFESTLHNRLIQEMGFDCELKKMFQFRYFTKFDNGLIENELDHVYVGRFNGTPIPNKNEVNDWKWLSKEEITNQFSVNNSSYTYWFKAIFPMFCYEYF